MTREDGPNFPGYNTTTKSIKASSFTVCSHISLGDSKVLSALSKQCMSLSLSVVWLWLWLWQHNSPQHVKLFCSLLGWVALLVCKKEEKKWAVFYTLPVLGLSACEPLSIWKYLTFSCYVS